MEILNSQSSILSWIKKHFIAVISVVVLLVIIVSVVVWRVFFGPEPCKGSACLDAMGIFDLDNDFSSNFESELNGNWSLVGFSSIKDSKDDNNIYKNNSIPRGQTNLVRLKAGKVWTQVWNIQGECDDSSTLLSKAQAMKDLLKNNGVVFPFSTIQVRRIQSKSDAKKLSSYFKIETFKAVKKSQRFLEAMVKNYPIKFISVCDCPEETSQIGDIVEIATKLSLVINLIECDANQTEIVFNKITNDSQICYTVKSKTLNDHQKDIIDRVKEKGGVVLITLLQSLYENITEVVDAFAEVYQHTNSCDYLGLASGFDRKDKMIPGLENPSKIPVIFDELFKRNETIWNKECLNKIASGNVWRLLDNV
uniref:Dipeptidase n=1 Tax=Cuerna arida TaxID=1464854 RepID=A0A1B6ESF4_9HEMI